jgi:hypothetical protein
MQDVFGMTGVATRDPETRMEKGLVGAGEAASYLVPAAGALRAAMGGTGMAAGAGQMMAGQFINAPKTAIAGEMAAGAGAEMLQDVARERFPENELAQGLAAVGGGLAGAGAVGAASQGAQALSKLSPIMAVIRGVKSATMPFTREGGRIIAEDAVQGMTADRDRAVDRLLGEENIGDLTPAQQTGETGLMALERGFAQRDPALAERLTEGVARSRETLTGETAAPAQGRTARDTALFFNERVDQHRKYLDGLVRRAEGRADAALRQTDRQGDPMAQCARSKLGAGHHSLAA